MVAGFRMNPPEPFSILFCFCLMDFSLAGHVIGQAVHANVDGSDDSRDETVFILDFNSSFFAGFEVRDCTLQEANVGQLHLRDREFFRQHSLYDFIQLLFEFCIRGAIEHASRLFGSFLVHGRGQSFCADTFLFRSEIERDIVQHTGAHGFPYAGGSGLDSLSSFL